MPPLTCTDQLTNELLLHADIDGQFPDLLLGLGQSPLRGHGSWGLAGLNRDLATTDCYNIQIVRISTLTEHGRGRGVVYRGSLGAPDQAYRVVLGWQQVALLGRPLGPSCQVGSLDAPLPSDSSC